MMRTNDRTDRRTDRRTVRRRTAEELYPEAYLVRDNIMLLSGAYGITDAEICEAIGASRETLRRRKKEPWNFTESEKKRIAELLHISVAALYTDLRGTIISAAEVTG